MVVNPDVVVIYTS